MVFESKNLGSIEYKIADIITFDKGLFAFENEKDYILIRNEETEFYYLQSLTSEDITFILVDLRELMPEYKPEVSVEQLKNLGEISHNIAVYNICTIKEKFEDITVNLLGPIVINIDNRKGKQVVASRDEYTVKHKLFK